MLPKQKGLYFLKQKCLFLVPELIAKHNHIIKDLFRIHPNRIKLDDMAKIWFNYLSISEKFSRQEY